MNRMMRTICLTCLMSLAFAVPAVADGHVTLGGRFYSGGHPYHNGYYYMAPESAYTAVTVRPPAWYGAPAYYYPQSYLAPNTFGYPPATYPGVPFNRAGSYYMSAYSYQATYPW